METSPTAAALRGAPRRRSQEGRGLGLPPREVSLVGVRLHQRPHLLALQRVPLQQLLHQPAWEGGAGRMGG